MRRKPNTRYIIEEFPKALMHWHIHSNKREMPWKGERDPYRIWLSEIILQQTRVEQGRGYYERFVKTFPSVHDLAAAPEQQVFKLWEGLGYYARCRNLIATARHISTDLNGTFPNTYEGILRLKGIGPYTAAAIASFALDLPYAVLDGNVFRVLSRILDIETPVDSTGGKKTFQQLAQELLDKKHPAAYNQALMDFGATICKPLTECDHCFFSDRCLARLRNRQNDLPVKALKTKVTERWFTYFVLRSGNQIAIRRRVQKDIWQDLFEFLLIETAQKPVLADLLDGLQSNHSLSPGNFRITKEAALEQRLSHQLIHFTFLTLELSKPISIADLEWVPADRLEQFPFPKTLQMLLQKQKV